jgi:hypothetical protein
LLDERLQPGELRIGDTAAEAGELVIAAALIVHCGVGPFLQLFDEAIGEQSFHCCVQCGGTEFAAALRPLGDLLHDGIAVPRLVTQREKDVKGGGREREEGGWVRIKRTSHIS